MFVSIFWLVRKNVMQPLHSIFLKYILEVELLGHIVSLGANFVFKWKQCHLLNSQIRKLTQ
jgi:hypothetical protein